MNGGNSSACISVTSTQYASIGPKFPNPKTTGFLRDELPRSTRRRVGPLRLLPRRACLVQQSLERVGGERLGQKHRRRVAADRFSNIGDEDTYDMLPDGSGFVFLRSPAETRQRQRLMRIAYWPALLRGEPKER